MPIIKSAIKRARQQKVRHERNVVVKSLIKSKTKVVRAEITQGKVKLDDLKVVIAEIDKAAKRKVIHKNAAARKKSRLVLAYNAVASKPYGTESPSQPKGKKQAAKKPAAKDGTKAKVSEKPATKKAASKSKT